MNSIIKQLSDLFIEVGYKVKQGKLTNVAATVDNLPAVLIEMPTVVQCKVEKQGYAKRFINILMMENDIVESEQGGGVDKFVEIESKLLSVCNKLLDHNQVVEVEIINIEHSKAKFTLCNEVAAKVKLQLITIY